MAIPPAAGPRPGPATRMGTVIDPVIPRVAALLARRPDALSLAQGMVSWGPPQGVLRAVEEALAEAGAPGEGAGRDRYGAVFGEEELRQAVLRELVEVRSLDLEGGAAIVTAGSNMAFLALAQVICDPGDEVILPLPWYFNHAMAIQLAGGVPVGVEAGLIPDPDRLEAAITPRTRAIVTISPGNPTGAVIPEAVLAAVNRLCARRGLFHVSDEAYAPFVHGRVPHRSPGRAAGSGGHTISLYSLSKAFGMAGWRIGYGAVPAQLLPALAKVQDTNLICPPLLMQRAALAALQAGDAWIAPRVARLGERRRRLLESVAAACARGLDVRLAGPADGAFYGLLECATSLGGEELMERLVLRHGVALLPGESFGLPSRPGRGVLRLSYGMLAGEEFEVALGRLFAALAEISAEASAQR